MNQKTIIKIGAGVLIALSILTSCTKESYKYCYKLSVKNCGQNWEGVPYIATSTIFKGADLEKLNKETLDRWNVDSCRNYRIDTSWIEEVKCMGCKTF